MTKRAASELNLSVESDLKKRKLMNSNNHNHNQSDCTMTNQLVNGRSSFLRNKRKWIQYCDYLNHSKAWNRYSKCMENVYNGSFPDLHPLKIGNLITFRKNAQFEFMNGIIIRGQNTNPLNIYTQSSSSVCIKLLNDSLSTQTINEQICKINKTAICDLINTEHDIYSFIPKETFNFEYKSDNNDEGFFNKKVCKRKINKKSMRFSCSIICIDIADYEAFEHREIVWSQIEGFEWFPSQILFKWKNGKRLSPIMEAQKFGLVFILVAFFGVEQTAKIRLSQRHLLPFYNEPNLDILRRTRNDNKKYIHLTKEINNAMLLATLQQQINNRLHSQYHNDIHIKNALILDNLQIPKYYWLYQQVLVYNKHTQIWNKGRIMYFDSYSGLHFIVYDDHCITDWIDLDFIEYIDWMRDDVDDDYSLFDDEKMHTLNGEKVHNICLIHGYGVNEYTTNVVSLSSRLIAYNTKNCNKCWICNEMAMINVTPIATVDNVSDSIISIHCICCRRRAHLNCLRKCGINRKILKNHLLSVHCDECKKCVLCKRSLEPQSIVKWVRDIFDINSFINNHFIQKNKTMIECNLCRRNFHKKCLIKYDNNNNELWLCFECRICRCCNTRDTNEWFEGYTLCSPCNEKKDKICKICFKHNNMNVHQPFFIECNTCNQYIHLSCSPFTLDQILNIKRQFICYTCYEGTIQRIQLNVLRYLINNDNQHKYILNQIHSILILRTHCLSQRITLLHFINIFRDILGKYDANIINKIIEFLCEIIATYFNLIFAVHNDNNNKLLRIIKDGSSCNYECKYVSNHELLILSDICISCGSNQDIDKMIICKRCSVTFHSYCIRSNIDFTKTDNIGYCYECLWYFYQNKVKVKLLLKHNTQNDNEWMMQKSYLLQLYQLSQNNELNHDSFDEFIVNNKIPLWIKPFLCDIINDTQFTVKYKERMTTKRITTSPSSNTFIGHKSSLYSSIQYQDGAKLNDNRKCELCNNKMDINICGRLLPVQCAEGGRRRECEWIHTKCALSSTDHDIDHCNKYGSNIISIDVTSILNKCAQYKCHICHCFGASMHCSVSDCTLSYHYPCIVSSQMYDIDWYYNSRPFFCNMHKMHFNNNDYTFGSTKMINMKTNIQNLYDECLIVLNDVNNMKFVSSKNKVIHDSKHKQLFVIKGNTVIKTVKDRNNNGVVLQQIYDTFWSYVNVGKRTQFIYESYAVNDGYLYKLIVNDDPLSNTIFQNNNSNKLFQKLIKKYPNTFDTDLFQPKYDYFL